MTGTWRDHALCRGLHDLFDERQENDDGSLEDKIRWKARHRIARSLCETCPVLTQCHNYAIYEHYGHWDIVAGMTGAQRWTYRRRHGIPKPEPFRGYKKWMAA